MTAVHAWWLLARPRLLPAVLALVGLGFGWAHWDRALSLRGAGALVGVLAGWTLLHAGTLWLNAELDRDEGEVLLGVSVPPPSGTAGLGRAALALGVVVVAGAHLAAGAAALACATLAVLYSEPRTAWKGHPVLGPLTNALGYGVATPFAGWVVVGGALDARTVAVDAVVVAGVVGCTFAAQAFQGAEDQARGYRTLVVTHGPQGALWAARVAFAIAFGGAALLVAAGWLPRLLGLALLAGWRVDRWLAAWARREDGGDARWAATLGRRLLDAVVVAGLLLTVDYGWSALAGQPVAGLSTASGVPHDRPVRPAWALRDHGARPAGEGAGAR